MKQITKEEAIKIFESKLWEDWSDQQIVEFQLFQKRLCMPFDVFHSAIERVLNRPVFNTEFAHAELLQKEFLGEKEPPTLEEIFAAIPEKKRILINA